MFAGQESKLILQRHREKNFIISFLSTGSLFFSPLFSFKCYFLGIVIISQKSLRGSALKMRCRVQTPCPTPALLWNGHSVFPVVFSVTSHINVGGSQGWEGTWEMSGSGKKKKPLAIGRKTWDGHRARTHCVSGDHFSCANSDPEPTTKKEGKCFRSQHPSSLITHFL